MKYLLFLFLISSQGLYAQKVRDIDLANIFIDNPKIVAKLDKENVNIIKYSVVKKDGVNTFTFEVDRTCFCPKKPGTLKVIQDIRPTYSDGLIAYEHTLVWNK